MVSILIFDDLSISVISSTVGINSGTEKAENNLFVSAAYPNPANQEFKVSYNLNDNNQNARLAIFNAVGNQVKTIAIRSNSGVITVPMNNLRNGVYFYRIVSGGEVSKTKRVVKQ